MTLKVTTRNMKEIKYNVVEKDFKFVIQNITTGERKVWVQRAESYDKALLLIPEGYEIVEDADHDGVDSTGTFC